MTSLLAPLADIIAEGDELLQEALAASMNRLCAVLLVYLKEQEVHHLLQLLLANMGHENASIRRSAATCIVAIARHAPVNPVDFVVLSLAAKFHLDKDLTVPFQRLLAASKENAPLKAPDVDGFSLLGTLNCFLQLTKLSYEELGEFLPRMDLLEMQELL